MAGEAMAVDGEEVAAVGEAEAADGEEAVVRSLENILEDGACACNAGVCIVPMCTYLCTYMCLI